MAEPSGEKSKLLSDTKQRPSLYSSPVTDTESRYTTVTNVSLESGYARKESLVITKSDQEIQNGALTKSVTAHPESQSEAPSELVMGNTLKWIDQRERSAFVFSTSSNNPVRHEVASAPCNLARLQEKQPFQATSKEYFSDLEQEHLNKMVDQIGSVKSDPTFPSGHIGVAVSDPCSDSSGLKDEYILKQEPLSDANSPQQQKEVPSFLSHSLPVVKKYFPFSETLALSFLHPLEVVTLTSKGIDIINERESISVHVADDTVPVGRILHLELGSSMHGRLSFPKNVRPVSPILWICPQEDIPLLKPIKITLPHTVKYEEGASELMFMKVHHEMRHETPFIMPTSTEYKFELEEVVHHEGIEFSEENGTIYTKQFCTLCITENVLIPETKKYMLLRTQPQNCNTSNFSVDYCVIYKLKTCLETFLSFCKEKDLKLSCNWAKNEFTFADTSGRMELTEPQSTSGWMVHIEGKKQMIEESEVDFWQHGEMLESFQKARIYPPRITIQLYRCGASNASKFEVHFSGTDPILEDSIVLLPDNNYTSVWKERPLSDTGKLTREYVTLQGNFSSVTSVLRTVPESKDQLCEKFFEKDWLDISANPSAKELVTLALKRIEISSHAFDEFMRMLSEISGMDLVVKKLNAKHRI